MNQLKTCKVCHIEKSLNEYNKMSPKTSDTLKTYCKSCQMQKNKLHYDSRKDTIETCVCGLTFKNLNKYEHKKTKAHVAYMKTIEIPASSVPKIDPRIKRLQKKIDALTTKMKVLTQ